MTPYRILQRRNEEIMRMYGLPSLLPHTGINLTKIRINSFCQLCLRLLLDPNVVFSLNGEQLMLPELKRDYQTLSLKLIEKAEKLSTNELIGKRLRYYRRLCGITGAKVASLWSEYASSKITQSTISNHETARFNDIKLADILTYINIYNSIIPLNPPDAPVLPGQITLDDIMFGFTFSALTDSISAELTNNTIQSSIDPDKPIPAKSNSEDDLFPISEIDPSDPRYTQSALRILIIKMAEGKCEYCKKSAPFRSKDNVPYLEIHRIDRSKGDSLTNCVALCPNCNRRLAFLQDDQMNKVLQEKASHHTVSSLFEQQQP